MRACVCACGVYEVRCGNIYTGILIREERAWREVRCGGGIAELYLPRVFFASRRRHPKGT